MSEFFLKCMKSHVIIDIMKKGGSEMKRQNSKKNTFSYESDGKMGKKNTDTNKKEQAEFFNTTQNSE